MARAFYGPATPGVHTIGLDKPLTAKPGDWVAVWNDEVGVYEPDPDAPPNGLRLVEKARLITPKPEAECE